MRIPFDYQRGFHDRCVFSECIHIRSCRARPGLRSCRISTNILTQPWTGAKWGRGGRDLARMYGSSFQEQIPRTNFQNDKGDRATSDQRTDVARPRFVMSFQKTRGVPLFHAPPSWTQTSRRGVVVARRVCVSNIEEAVYGTVGKSEAVSARMHSMHLISSAAQTTPSRGKGRE